MMTSIRDAILEMASLMDVGDRAQHELCPFCNGGDSRERSFLLWKDADGVAYKCYRVKCNKRGKIFDHAKVSGFKEEKKILRKSTTELLMQPLPEDCSHWISCVKFPWLGDDINKLGLLWDSNKERVLLPIANPVCKEGLLARYYPELAFSPQKVKAMAYYHDDFKGAPSCLMFPPFQMFGESLVLTEDYWSAARVALSGVAAAALCGTSITHAALDILICNNVENVLIILDSDAVLAANKMIMKYQLLFSDISTIRLSGPDIKDMSEAEFSTLKQELELWASSLR